MDFFNPYNNAYMNYTRMGMNGYLPPSVQSIPTQPSGMEVIPVQTIQQVEQVQIQPGQRKLVMVQNEPVIASRAADNMGLVTTEYYKLEKFTPGTATPQPTEYVTRQEFENFVANINKQSARAKKEASE